MSVLLQEFPNWSWTHLKAFGTPAPGFEFRIVFLLDWLFSQAREASIIIQFYS